MEIDFDAGKFGAVWNRVTDIAVPSGVTEAYRQERQAELLRSIIGKKAQCALLAAELGKMAREAKWRQTLFVVSGRQRRHGSRLAAQLFILTGEATDAGEKNEPRSGFLTGLRRLYMWLSECAALLNDVACGTGEGTVSAMLREMAAEDEKSAASVRVMIERSVK